MKQAFDIQKAIPAAWKLLWEDNLQKRRDGRDFRGNTHYLTATDVVEQVRSFAQEQAEGKTWGSGGRQWGRAYAQVKISTGGVPGGLLRLVREWLQRQARRGVLEEMDFGRGHISGARYRPAGETLTDGEQATLKRKAVPWEERTVHFYHAPEENASGRAGLLCQIGRKRRGHSWGWRRQKSRTSDDPAKVTCKQCANILDGTRPDPRKKVPTEA